MKTKKKEAMKNDDGGLVQKAEGTVAGLVQFVARYSRTFGILENPLNYKRLPLVFNSQRNAARIVPPLIFLSIGAFLFTIVVRFVVSEVLDDLGQSDDPKVLLNWVRDHMSDTSLTNVVSTALPTIAVIVFGAFLVSKALLFFRSRAKQQIFMNLVCYAFGLFCTEFFLLVVCINVISLAAGLHPNTWMQGRWFFWPRRIVVGAALLHLLIAPITILSLSLWRLSSGRRRVRKVLALLVLVIFYHAISLGALYAPITLTRLNLILASKNPLTPVFLHLRNSSQPSMRAKLESETNGDQNIFFNIVVRNGTEKSIFLKRDLGQVKLKSNFDKPLQESEFLSLVGDAGDFSTSFLTVPAGQEKVITCWARIKKPDYEKMAGKTITFEATINWANISGTDIRWGFGKVEDKQSYTFSMP